VLQNLAQGRDADESLQYGGVHWFKGPVSTLADKTLTTTTVRTSLDEKKVVGEDTQNEHW
jgi:hypothetical protein